MAHTQLTLRLSPQEVYRLDNFLFADEALQEAVDEFCIGQGYGFLYLCGASGAGKTHLCLAIAEQLQQQSSVAYLNFQELLQTAEPAGLSSLMQAEIICLDDVEAIADHQAWQEALFHAFNELRHQQKRLLIVTENPPAQLTIELADLRSRLATGLVFQLPVMTDQRKQQALILQAQSRGLILSDDVAQYLLRHYGRDMPSLMAVLQKLDKASLQAQRRLTIPFVKQVMQHGV
ncbi:MAG: DnaA regulatory inactivator Hda [Methylophaga sp.]|nr:DnaA regulatory inactivator Hda [Methylophaga sp.]